MTGLVLDASVALKWAIASADEPFTAESLRLLNRYVEGEINFIVPDIFWAETANVLWKGVRRRHWSSALATSASSGLADLDFFTVSSRELLSEALQLALVHSRTVYDCLYIALAIQFNTDLITADERLANSLAARLPVRWVGSLYS